MIVKSTLTYALLIGFLIFSGVASANADCFDCMSCAELIYLAKQSQQDLRAINSVLRSAISTGDLDMVRSYKLNKASALKETRIIMKALESKGCLAK